MRHRRDLFFLQVLFTGANPIIPSISQAIDLNLPLFVLNACFKRDRSQFLSIKLYHIDLEACLSKN
jgi:hypothetical protein